MEQLKEAELSANSDGMVVGGHQNLSDINFQNDDEVM